MQSQKRQRGLGLWGWIFVLATIGFVSMVTLQLVPIYLAELSIQRVVKTTASDPGLSSAQLPEIRASMKTRWDVEGITTLDPKDVKLERFGQGRALAYDYEARAELFYNVSLVVHFEKKFPMAGGTIE
jgi:hypothetical protein